MDFMLYRRDRRKRSKRKENNNIKESYTHKEKNT